jgi:hypothetical protein
MRIPMMQKAMTREAGPPVARALPEVTKRPVPEEVSNEVTLKRSI